MKWGYKGTLISLFHAEARELGKLKKKNGWEPTESLYLRVSSNPAMLYRPSWKSHLFLWRGPGAWTGVMHPFYFRQPCHRQR